MTAVVDLPVRRLRARPATAAVRAALWWLGVATVGFGSLGLHLFRLQRSYDLFIDEPFYVQVSQSVAHGHLPFADGKPFFLHPPGYFLLAAGWIHGVGDHGDVLAAVFSQRVLVAWLAAITAAVLTVVVGRLTNRVVGLVTGVIYLLDNFMIRETSLVILETATLLWTVLGYALLLRLPADGRRRLVGLVGTGLLFGASILTKEFAVFVTLLPMLFCVVKPAALSRREAGLVAGVSVLPYLVWVVVVVANGLWSPFWTQTTSGFRRGAGTEQISGFNRPGAPSFVHTVVTNLPGFWTAYLFLALAAVAAVFLAWRRSGTPRLVGYLALGALPLLAYSVTLGANEEQFYNFLLVPGFLAVPVAAWQLRRHWESFAVSTAVIVVLVACVASDVTNYALTRSRTDSAALDVGGWMAAHVPAGQAVGVTNAVQREILKRYQMVDVTPTTSLADLNYVVVFQRQLDLGYGFTDAPSLDARLAADFHVVFRSVAPSNGDVFVYERNPPVVVSR